MPTELARKLLGEGLGTAGLLAVVIGSGIMAERLSGGHAAVALLANTLATVGGLYVLIEVFGPVSGAHFNPAVSIVMARETSAQTIIYVNAGAQGSNTGSSWANAHKDLQAALEQFRLIAEDLRPRNGAAE